MTKFEKFMLKVRKEPSGCWIWTRAINAYGYGKLKYNNKHTSSHRVAYQELVGPIPAGLQLDHLCRNRACCNPAHLEPVTCRENLLRGDTLQAKNIAKTHCHRGHAYSAENTYRYPDGRRRCIACRKIDDNQDGPRARRRDYKRRMRAKARMEREACSSAR